MFECKHQKSCGEFEKSINKSSSLVSNQNMRAKKLTHITYEIMMINVIFKSKQKNMK